MQRAFTLIELLVVIAVIAVLSIVVLLTLNPAQLLMQSRDSNRISDMSTLNSALGDYLAEGGINLGSSNIIYVSIPDPTATSTAGDQCQGLGLISLPTGYSYQCAATSTYKLTNGNGWIPVNFASATAGSPLSILPIDPINQSSSRLYYTYTTNGSQYEITSVMESQKYQLGGSNDVISTDGGTLASVYEKGSKLALEPLDYGDNSLVGLWTFNEGTGTIAYDYSGNNATGSWNGSAIGSSGTYYSTTARVGTYAGDFDGASTYVAAPSLPGQYGTNFTITAWVKTTNHATMDIATINRTVHNNEFIFLMTSGGLLTFWDYSAGYGFSTSNTSSSSYPVYDGNWHLVVFVRSGTTGQYYVDGIPAGTVTAAQYNTFPFTTLNISHVGDSDGTWNGLIDDVRIYNRTLTAAQIAAMYAGGK